MLSFVWSSKYPFYAGAGGSENYTAGQIYELRRRGVPARILTLGHGEQDGRDDFGDIPFKALDSVEELRELDDTLVFITYPLNVKTKHPSYAILHCPPPKYARGDKMYNRRAFKGKRLIATSKFASKAWKQYLGPSVGPIKTVYPFAEAAFKEVERPNQVNKEATRILFAGRLTPDKGIYTLLAALHMDELEGKDIELTVTAAGKHTDEGEILYPVLKAHPNVTVVEPAASSKEMAKLMAKHDIVVMPSTSIFWKEMFGMVSVEAQHAGCRVVASRSGGLSETNCGGLHLVEPDNPKALAAGIAKAAELGPLTSAQRAKATRRFTVKQSVDQLLSVLADQGDDLKNIRLLREGAELLPNLKPYFAELGEHLLRATYPGERSIQK